MKHMHTGNRGLGGPARWGDPAIPEEERRFLRLARENRPILLDRLQDLGLLPSFLEAENGTKPEF